MKPRHIISSLVAIGAAAVLLAGCGGGSSASKPASHASSPPTSGAASDAVTISDFKFAPDTLTADDGNTAASTPS